jgi:hypothetical protein
MVSIFGNSASVGDRLLVKKKKALACECASDLKEVSLLS